ncbi:hypothetical protein [Catellatospora tritici]|uniref:hypothetical protein n=1 Tax=Catellatospora tritici TaxID=2851566 RepID=UPI001C2DA6F7|nr:hypothetical protein [Catellatospora tritici]MBV1854576.1 hypothetical protein [Catellatospora tritici]
MLGLLIAGEGFVAVRDWFNVAGARGVALSNLADVVTIAAMTAVAGVVAALAGGVLAWPAGRSSGPPQRALLVIAATVAVGVPVIGAAVSGQMTVTTVGAVAVAWSLPWTSGLVAAAYAKPEVRRALVAAVAVCAVVAVLSVVLQPQ